MLNLCNEYWVEANFVQEQFDQFSYVGPSVRIWDEYDSSVVLGRM